MVFYSITVPICDSLSKVMSWNQQPPHVDEFKFESISLEQSVEISDLSVTPGLCPRCQQLKSDLIEDLIFPDNKYVHFYTKIRSGRKDVLHQLMKEGWIPKNTVIKEI